MNLGDFLKRTECESKNEVEKAKLLCWYLFKESGKNNFQFASIINLFKESGFSVPNETRLKSKMMSGPKKILIKKASGYSLSEIEIVELKKQYNSIWSDESVAECQNKFIDSSLFNNAQDFLKKLIAQVNKCYEENCYDGAAVLIRRVLEILLILSFRKCGEESKIKDENGRFLALDKICKEAVSSLSLSITRPEEQLKEIKDIGNFSAHKIEYNARKSDLDNQKINIRVTFEQLLYKAGIN